MKPMSEQHFAVLRRHMVEVVEIHAELSSEELGKPELDERVLAAMQKVPRHRFVPDSVASYAYQDMPLPIGFDKTISQPFIVALMTDLLDPQAHESVLEIGTGLGYQAAILAELADQVWSVEVIEEFARQAEATLRHTGMGNVDDPYRRRLARLARACAVRQDHRDGRGAEMSAAAAGAAETRRPHGPAAGPAGRPALDRHRQDVIRRNQIQPAHPGPLQRTRDGEVGSRSGRLAAFPVVGLPLLMLHGLGLCRRRGAPRGADERHLDLDFERRDVLAAIQPHLDGVGVDLHVLADDGQDFLAQDRHEVGLAAGAALVGEQNLQALTGRRERSAVGGVHV
jgi:hypothetical protein